ncbi:hypothetical protein CCB80_04280 [Armatimonadetes bacterium Uphvl-Ar1]|nr:hypothetical protein CCB80_04280 [Armatimonadetes bacterium Uphvl-Ar1]
MKRILIVALSATIASSAFGVNLYSNQSSNVNVAALNFSTTTRSGVTAGSGTMWSEVQANGAGVQLESNTTAGFGMLTGVAGPPATGNRLADDFTVGGLGWNVTGLAVFAYSTGATANPFTGGTLNIWSGRPGDANSTIVTTGTWFNSTDQLQLDANTVGVGNRIFNTNSPAPGSAPGTTRRIWQNNFTLAVTLNPGTYWMDFSLTAASGFAPSTTHQDVRGVVGANGRQRTNSTGVWADMIDTGNPATAADVAQEVPFIVSGTEVVPEPMTMGVLALGAAALAARKRRKS